MFTKSAADITFSDIEEFCREFGEGGRVEYKREIEVKKHIPKIVSSFSNTFGGFFVIGADTDEENKVIFPIPGIPKRAGIEEQIQQSALTGIYPAVVPEIIIRDVPNTDNVVVIVRVDESVQAPHAIQNSTRVYIRTGSITQPYELAEVDRIEYMLKRREDSQQVTRQIRDRTKERIESLFETNEPNLTVVARPVFPYRPIISTRDIFDFESHNEFSLKSYSSRIVGGIYVLTDKGLDSKGYWELNEYGIVYHWASLPRMPSRSANTEKREPLDFQHFVSTIGELIKKSRSFYEKCEYSGNIEITAHLRQVFNEKLSVSAFEHPNTVGLSADAEVLAATQCLPRDLSEREKFLAVVDEFASQLLWAFNIGDPIEDTAAKRRELVERILETAGLIDRIMITNENG